MLTGVLRGLTVAGKASGLVNITVQVSTVLEERDESVRGLVTSWRPLVECGDSFQGSSFEFKRSAWR